MLIWADLLHRHSLVEACIPNASNSLLDLGGFASSIHKETKDKWGVEWTAVNWVESPPHLRPTLVGDIRNRLFLERSFDTVTLIDTIEHIEPPYRAQVLEIALSYAKNRLVVTYPFFNKRNVDSESLFLDSYRKKYKNEAVSIAEHRKLGLPGEDEFDHLFKGRHFTVEKTLHTMRSILFEGLRLQIKEDSLEERKKISASMNALLNDHEPIIDPSSAYRVRLIIDR